MLAVIPCVLTCIADSTEQPIRRAFHATATTVEHVGVDHRRPHVSVPEQLLDLGGQARGVTSCTMMSSPSPR